MFDLVCQTCGVEFEWQNSLKKFCPLCSRERRSAQQCEYQKIHDQTEVRKASIAKYAVSDKGKVKRKAAQCRYLQTPKGKASKDRHLVSEKNKVAIAKYKASEKGKASKAKYQASPEGKAALRRYLKSDKGKAYVQAMNAKVRYGQNYYQYLAFKNEAFRDQLSCVRCGVSWIDGLHGVTHEVDHVIPRALGGTHDHDNLQVLCYECHKAKTSNDLKDIARAKRK